jgi:EF-hand domain pair/EF hand
MFRVRVLCAALAALPAAALVHAQTAPPAKAQAQKAPPVAEKTGKSPFDEIDTNHDGFITRDEFMAAQKKHFDEFDTNHDGKIDAKEIANSPPLMERNMRMAERMVQRWDANNDGVVTTEEFKKFSEDRFTKMDKEGTGKIARRNPPAAVQRKAGPQAKPVIQPAPTSPKH